jgi:hypothetical protein
MSSSQESPKLSLENENAAANEIVQTPPEVEKFKPSARFMLAFTSLAIVNLACALDATTIGVALPVSFSLFEL